MPDEIQDPFTCEFQRNPRKYGTNLIPKKNYIHLFPLNLHVTGLTVFLFTKLDNPNREIDDMPKITQLEGAELGFKLRMVP